MKKTLVLLVLLLVVSCAILFSAEPREGIAVGATTGSPFLFGVTGEYNFGAALATATLAYASNSFLIRVGGDYHLEPMVVWGDLEFHPSIGGQLDLFIGLLSAVALGAPVTLAYYFDDIPLKLALKIGPEIFLSPAIGFDLVASISGLYQL